MAGVSVSKGRYGLLSDGTKVHLFTLTNGKMSVSASDYGCTLTSILLPARGRSEVDVLLGFSSLEGLLGDGACFGTIVGRFANRIGGAAFTLDGTEYRLDRNDGQNTLHGGFDRWEKKVWGAERTRGRYGEGVRFFRTSHDGEQGFPGRVRVEVCYTLNEENELTLEYSATADRPTPIGLTNHAYFNLKGYDGGSVMDQELRLYSDEYLEVDGGLVPTGERKAVAGTPFDFTAGKLVGADAAAAGGGYDHCFCVRGFSAGKPLRLAAELRDPASGRQMAVRTTEPGMQVYTGNCIGGIRGKNGFLYQDHGGICLEAEAYPDAPNRPEFPSAILRPGEIYHQVTQYCFGF